MLVSASQRVKEDGQGAPYSTMTSVLFYVAGSKDYKQPPKKQTTLVLDTISKSVANLVRGLECLRLNFHVNSGCHTSASAFGAVETSANSQSESVEQASTSKDCIDKSLKLINQSLATVSVLI